MSKSKISNKKEYISTSQTDKVPVHSRVACSPTAKNDEQKDVLKSFYENQLTFIYGPPGSGKTFLAIMYGLNELLNGRVDRIILTRPAVEAYGERLGYLPGDMDEKIAPYMLPIMDFLSQKLEKKYIEQMINQELIMMLPLAFMRGITFKNAFVLFDEAQNSIPQQMRLFLTRTDSTSKIIVTGDLNQSDHAFTNGLQDAIARLDGIKGIGIKELTMNSIIRSDLVRKIEEKYQK